MLKRIIGAFAALALFCAQADAANLIAGKQLDAGAAAINLGYLPLAPNGVASGLSHLQPFVGAVPETLGDRSPTFVSMSDFMTVGQPDGVTDNSADFRKLNNFCGNSGNTLVNFTGSIAGGVLNVSAMTAGSKAITPGTFLFGSGIAANTYVISRGTGTGGAGTYNVSGSQTVAAETMSATSVNVIVYLQPLHYKYHDVLFNCGVQFVGVRGAPLKPATSPIAPQSGTVLDYTDATAYGTRWAPVGWPAVSRFYYTRSPGMTGVTLYTTNENAAIFAAQIWGAVSPVFDKVDSAGMAGSIFDYYGGFGGLFNEITINWTSGVGVLFRGDEAGVGLDGTTPCRTDPGSCSTRLDVPMVNHVNVGPTSTAICFELRGFVATPEYQHTSCENGYINLKSSCPAGFLSVAECPTFIRGYDMQGEYQTFSSTLLTDTSDFKCFQCYAVGAAGVGSSQPTVSMEPLNYGVTGGSNGGFSWTDGTIDNAAGDCARFGVPDVHIVGGNILYCNLGNSGGAGIIFDNSGYAVDESISGTVFCRQNGIPSAPYAMAPWNVGSPSTNVRISADTNFSNCSNTGVGAYQIGFLATAATSVSPLTNQVTASLATLTLYPGAYECIGSFLTHPAAGTVTSFLTASLSTSGSFVTDVHSHVSAATIPAGNNTAASTGPYNVNITTATNIAIGVYTGFSGGLMTIDTLVSCKRIS